MNESEINSTGYLNEGQLDPVMNKIVKFLILELKGQYAIYVDTNLDIQWYADDATTQDEAMGRVLNRAAILESKMRFVADEQCKLSLKRQIGEGIARFIKYKNIKLSSEIFDLVDAEIHELNIKQSWGWYFNTAYVITIFCISLFGILWIWRLFYISLLSQTGFDVVLAGLMGSLGALISIIARGNKINLDANAGRSIHLTEGTARVVVGVAGAVLVALAYKSGILLSGLTLLGNKFAALLTLAIIAGASERLVPSLISKVESASASK